MRLVPDAPTLRLVPDEPSVYSPEGLAGLRQAEVQSIANARRAREEADAELERTRYRVGLKPYGMDEPLFSAEIPAGVAAFGSEMIKSAAPTGAGAAAASAVTPYSSRAADLARLIPGAGRFASPAIRYGIPTVVGGGAALLTRMGEDVVLPEILPEDMARSYEAGTQAAAESPLGAMAGQFAGAGPFFRPGLPINTTGGARLAVPAITGGIGGGIEGAQQLMEGEFDPQRLALAAAGSAFMNRETALGRRIAPNLVLPNLQTADAPIELAQVGRTLREPVLPEPTDIIPAELAAVRQAEAISAAEQTAARAEGERAVASLDDAASQAKIRALGERMMGKTPSDQLAILDQEMRLQKDTLTVAEQRAGLDLKQELKRQIEAQKAMEQAANDQQKAMADQQKALADAQKAQAEAMQPPEIPKSAQILAEPVSKPPALANVATEIATQTKDSPYALQSKLNQMTAVPEMPAAVAPAPLDTGIPPERSPVTTDPAVVRADRAEYDRLQAEMKKLKPLSPEYNALWQKSEDVKNRHGGFVPTSAKQTIRSLLDKLDDGTEIYTGRDLRDDIEGLYERGEMPSKIKKAIDDYDAMRESDYDEFGARSGLEEEGEEAFIRAVRSAAGKGGSPKSSKASKVKEPKVDVSGILNAPNAMESARIGGSLMRQFDSIENMRAIQKAMQEYQPPPTNALQKQIPSESVLRPEAERPDLNMELPGVAARNTQPEVPSGQAQEAAVAGRPAAATRAASLRRQQRGAIPASVLAPLAGSASGAATGYLVTERREGETEEQFQARRLKATLGGAVIGAGSGVLAGGALSRGAKARAAAPKPRVPGAPVDLPTTGPDQGVRQTAEKVILNESYPEKLRQTLADDPAIIYDKISRNQYRDTVAAASDPELQQMLTSGDPLMRISAQAEIGSRLSVTPGMEDEGARVIAEFSKNFTSPAQILGLAGIIRSPKAMVQAVEDTLRLSVGKGKPLPQMTPAVRKKLFDLSSDNIKAETRFAQAERAARKNYNPATRDEFVAARDALGVSKKKLADYTKDILPERYGQIVSKIIKGNLLAPLSFAKNMFGNAAWQTLLRGSESLATVYDAIYSGAAGKPRVMGLGNPLPGKEELQALGDGIRIAGKELLTGPSSESYIKAEVQRGFHPLRAMLQTVSGIPAAERAMERAGIASLPRTPSGGVRVNDRAKKLIEATLGIAPEASFRFLNLGDKPVRYAVQQRILTEQANLKGLKGVEREKFMLLPDPETQALMETESMGGILAQENKAALKVGRFMDEWMVDVSEAMGQGRPGWLEDANKVLGTLVIPYRQFPANFAITAANFALPPVGMARAWAQSAKGNQREALRNMGEATIGFMLLGAAGYLWDKGLISEPADPKDKKRRSSQYETMGAQRLNISGLERLQAGGDPTYKRGDHTIDWSSMGPPAASFYALTKMKSSDVNKASRTGEIPKERSDFDAFLNVMDVAGFAFDQSFLSGTSAALDAFKDWENYGDRFLQNTFRAITSIPAPNSLEAFNRTQYKFIPEQKGDTTTETLRNVWDYKTGQLDQGERQNYKRDFWGNPILRTPEGQNPYISQFIDVTKGERKAHDPFKQSLLELYQQTRSTDVYPPLVTRYVSNNGVTVELDADDYDMLQDFTGQVRESLGRQVTSDPRFASQDVIPEAKIEYLNRVYSAGAKAGKAQLFQSAGFADKYPELFGAIPKAGHKSRVVARDTQARGRLRLERDTAPQQN